jgi:phosphoadenosine phosphosulfate reductase
VTSTVVQTRLRPVAELRELSRQGAARLTQARAEEVVEWAVEQFGPRLAVACSMAEAVLPHMVSKVLPGVDVVFLDTGYHFDDTLHTRDAVRRRLPVTVVDVTPRRSVVEQDEEFGSRMHSWDPVQCCEMRKVAPLRQALTAYEAWATGVRREDSDLRKDTPVVGWDTKNALVKVNPLASWTQADLEQYVRENDVPLNPLLSQGYPSIGCAPCTRRVSAGEDARSGRWEGFEKTECGIHI